MARLEVLKGSYAGRSFSFSQEVFLGRGTENFRDGDNFISLPDKQISRRHARIARQESGYAIEDLNSTNGVFLRGKRIPPATPCMLKDGDAIRLCTIHLVFRIQENRAEEFGVRAGSAVLEAGILAQGDVPVSLRMLEEATSQPAVAVSLDATLNLTDIDVNRQYSGKDLSDILKRLQAMCQVSIALGAITDRKRLMQRIMDLIFEIFPAAERSFIMLRGHDEETLKPVAGKKRQGSPGQREEVAISQTIINQVITHKRAILSFDALSDDRFNGQESIINLSIRSMMCAPLLVGEEVLGLIQVDTYSGPRTFTADDLQILTGISTQAAIAVKNSQLYAAIETETARRTSLQRYFSPNLVEMLMSGDITTSLGGNTYEGTLLFADILGFTALSEIMPPDAIVALLNRYFTIMQKVIYDNEGNVDKFSGDAIMAFWGVPHPAQCDTYNAVFTALRMQEKLWAFNLDLEAEHCRPIYTGIGLNSGEFVAGNVGSEDKIEFTLIGDTVNLASRIEDLAGRYQIFAARETWERLKPTMCAIHFPPLQLKGKSRSTTIYSIRALRDRRRGGVIMALPCDILDPCNTRISHGLLTGSKGNGANLRLLFSTPMPLTPGDVLTLCPLVSEYHQPLRFSATVESCSAAAHDGTTVYTKAVLSPFPGEEALMLCIPGTCVPTSLSWDKLQRK